MKKNKTIVGIIPARFASVRFPGKPLAQIMNKPMVQWVYEALASTMDYLCVATDDERIFQAVRNFGGKVVLTSPDHPSGTDRCREAIGILEKKGLRADIAINIQGDEPLIRPEQITELIHCLDEDEAQIATLYTLFRAYEDPGDPNLVKVVVDKNGRALYFSRALIPFPAKTGSDSAIGYYKHVGLYGYKIKALKEICTLAPSPLERAESLEQLRWLENGYLIKAAKTDYVNIGIDTPGDIEKVIGLLKERKFPYS